MPNKLSQFWQELKRRNVVRVITVYAGAAFVILELVSIIAEPLKLPDWLLPVVIVLLSVGFFIAVIVSWIYDVHPEGGVVKTKPAEKMKAEDIPKSSNGWKIASYISFVVIVGLIVLHIIPRANNNRNVLEKSIAVLPFINESPELENNYLIDGYRTAVHDNLCQIKDLRVLSLESTERYKDQTKSKPEMAKELGVGYLLSARGQILNNKIRLTVQLADANDLIIWSNPYNRKTELVDDHIDIQSDIAELVARKLETTITPEEKQRIANIPTISLTALDFYQRGVEQLKLYRFEDDRSALNEAENQFHLALTYDSTFAAAYVGLARIYLNKRYWSDYLSDDYMDSVLIQANRALKFDDKLAEAYNLRGDYYYYNGEIEQSNREYEKVLLLNPNDWEAFRNISFNYRLYFIDYIKAIVNMENAIIRNRGLELPHLLDNLGYIYVDAGFSSLAEKYFKDHLTLTKDTASYYNRMAWLETADQNWMRAMEYYEKAINIDSTEIAVQEYYSNAGLYQKQYDIYMTLIRKSEERGEVESIHNLHRLAYVCWKLEKYDEANYYFKQQISYGEESIKLGRLISRQKYAQYDLAGVYSFLGQKDQAYQYLHEFNTLEVYPKWLVTLIKNDPLFESIRDEPEFQQIVDDVEAKYQTEHERVRQWLEENNML